MDRGPRTSGYILVSMMGPILGIAGFVAVVIWLVLGRWESFPPLVRTGLKVLGALAVLVVIAGNVITSRGPNGGRRGF